MLGGFEVLLKSILKRLKLNKKQRTIFTLYRKTKFKGLYHCDALKNYVFF